MDDLRKHFYLGLEMARRDIFQTIPQPDIERIWPSSVYGSLYRRPQFAFAAGWAKARGKLTASKLLLRAAKSFN